MQSSTLALIITLVAMVCFITEKFPISVTALSAAIAMALFGVIEFKDVYAGFGNDTILLLVGVMIIGNALLETGVAEKIGNLLKKSFAKSEKVFLVLLMVVAAAMSMFMSNVAVVALFTPIVTSVIASTKGKISKKSVFLPLGIAACVGGLFTLIGSPPQMVAQAILIDGGYRPMGFFELSIFAAPLMFILIAYFLTIGMRLLGVDRQGVQNTGGPEVEGSQAIKDDDPKRKRKQLICAAVLAGCVAAFIAQIFTNGIIAMIGGLICIITGCIGDKKAYVKMDWATILFTVGTLGFAKGIEVSGAGEKIAGGMIGLLGGHATPFLVLVVLMGCAVLVTSFISNTATTALLVPIGISLAHALGMNVTTVVIGIVAGANISFATPMAAPAMVMTAGLGEYRFIDFVKTGSIFSLLCYLVLIVVMKVFMPL